MKHFTANHFAALAIDATVDALLAAGRLASLSETARADVLVDRLCDLLIFRHSVRTFGSRTADRLIATPLFWRVL